MGWRVTGLCEFLKRKTLQAVRYPSWAHYFNVFQALVCFAFKFNIQLYFYNLESLLLGFDLVKMDYVTADFIWDGRICWNCVQVCSCCILHWPLILSAIFHPLASKSTERAREYHPGPDGDWSQQWRLVLPLYHHRCRNTDVLWGQLWRWLVLWQPAPRKYISECFQSLVIEVSLQFRERQQVWYLRFFPLHLQNHDCLRTGPPDIGELISVTMPDDQVLNASFVKQHVHKFYQVRKNLLIIQLDQLQAKLRISDRVSKVKCV